MKKIVCDLCGESDFVKVEGMFECQVCGAKYSVDEAKTLFRDVADDKPQHTKQVENEKYAGEKAKTQEDMKNALIQSEEVSQGNEELKAIIVNL